MTIIFSTPESRSTLAKAKAAGRLRPVVRGSFTDDLHTPLEDVVAAHQWELVAHYIPDAVVVDRSAAGGGSSVDGHLFVASPTRARNLELPGLTVIVRDGPQLDSDLPWAEGLRISCPGRTLVDNLAISRGRGHVARTLDRDELGDWAARQVRLNGSRFDRIVEDAHRVAEELGVPERIEQIDELVAALHGAAPAHGSVLLAAHAAGRGIDDRRIDQFARLTDALSSGLEVDVPEWLDPDDEGDSSLGFWESYFSNHIEGTVFPVEEAQRIVQTGELPIDRPADGHDILGTYRVITDPVGRRHVPETADEFLHVARARHHAILVGRPELRPGQWKRERNQAGTYPFVEPDLVEGTLAAGFDFRDRLREGFPRALFMLFLVSEVHPFVDGNGRVARTFMNAELTAAGQARIAIPVVWRNEYMTAMRQMSRNDDVVLYQRTLAFAWRWTAAMPWTDPAATRIQLERTNALVDSTDAANEGVQLELP